MKKWFTAGLIGFMTVSFAGCSKQFPALNTQSPSTTQTQSGSDLSPSPVTKVGKTTKTGQVIQLGGKYNLQQTGQSPIPIDSYSVDLSTYLGKTVTITGEYSGDTLFVGAIQ
jgi:hypothetical protein